MQGNQIHFIRITAIRLCFFHRRGIDIEEPGLVLTELVCKLHRACSCVKHVLTNSRLNEGYR